MLYHGIPINSELIVLILGGIVWIIRGITKAFKQTGKPGLPPPPLQAPPPSQAVPRGQIPPLFQPPATLQPARLQAPPPSQPLPARAPRLDTPRPRERQPQAGGPAVPEETTRQDFERQEREMFGAEPAALGASLTSAPVRPSAPVNSLFGGTDDLVRAIILQEVLGPPLSRRKPQPPEAPTQSAPQSSAP